MSVRMWGQLIIQPLIPQEDPVIVGTLWSDTTTPALKRCTSVSPYTFVSVEGGSSVTPAALTEQDDTNVTMSLSGTPATALLQAVKLTLGWTGLLGLIRGGTNADLSATGGAGQYLKQSSSGAAITVGTIPASDIASGAALTEVNDTNVTLVLGGTPATALLASVSLTLGWTGTLAAARLNANVVQSITNDTNVQGSISAQVLTLTWSGQLSIARGGTGQATAQAGFDALSPLTTIGDLLYYDGSHNNRLGASSATGQFLSNEGASNIPAWAYPSEPNLIAVNFTLPANQTMTIPLSLEVAAGISFEIAGGALVEVVGDALPALGYLDFSAENNTVQTINLSTQGTIDWFAPIATTYPYKGSAASHAKLTGGWILDSFAWIFNSGTLATFSSGLTMTTNAGDDITNGSLLSSTVTGVDIGVNGTNFGWRFRVPCTPAKQFLRIWASLFECDIQLTIQSLSGVIPTKVFIDRNISNTNGRATFYKIAFFGNYGDELIVSALGINNTTTTPNIAIVAATLAGS